MRPWSIAAFLLGLALAIALLIWQGIAPVADALALAGWGLVAAALSHWLALIADAFCWWRLLPAPRPTYVGILGARWLGESVNNLLPVARIGGELTKARLAHLQGVSGARAGASVVGDLTLAAVTQIVFALIGVVLLVAHFKAWSLAGYLVLGVVVMMAAVLLFAHLQRRGLFGGAARRLERLAGQGGRLHGLAGDGRAADAELRAIYARRGTLAVGAIARLSGWMLGAVEVWLAMYFLGAPVTVAEALIIESLGQTIRGAAFMIPGSMGVQDGGYALLVGVVGYGTEIGLALALARRVRELLLGVPGLIVWKLIEGRRALRRAREERGVTAATGETPP